ncbi:MAG: acyl carrier protein [Kiritimatiellae bacterium]|nr:acyl carrier protein [Kiritimatiellia bacterium]
MTSQEIDTRLKQMIVDRLFLKVSPQALESESSLIDDYGVDSVCLLELVVGLEDEFGIQIEDGDFNVRNFESVAALRAFVQQRLPT